MFLSGCNIAAQKQAQSPSANHLLGESSSYLLEHVNDPVDWYPWGKEALAKARQEDKPIFLSIGYSSCHWCHVMHRECFQNAELARLLNENFVCIKVDREQRPDLDDTYMQVTEAMTGRGGWPMTLLLTAELKPFFAATYLPPSLLKALIIKTKDDWRNNRTNLNKLADDAVVYLHAADEVDGSRRLERSQISTNIDKALSAADPVYGGIGMEHKFPPPALISLLMAHSNISGPASREENLRRLRSLRFSYRTLDAMALMGLHDYLGGGFYRYCVDRRWSTPHFEKMLYTNALLAQSYLDGFLLSGKPYWADTARSTLDFCLRDLGAADGFYCSLDADSDGKEGLTYLFTRAEIYKLLAGKDAEWFCRNFNVSETGNFKGRNILYLERDPESLARQEGLTYFQWAARAKALGDKLLAARAKRPQPRRDEKILVGWNGLMISSLVQGYKVLGDEKYLLAARKTAAFLLSKIKSGALPHDCCAAADSGFLDDYAFTVQGLLDLGLVDPVLGDSAGAGSYPGAHPDWLAAAKKLNAETIERFYDSKNGGFYLVAGNQEQVLRRARIFADEVLPSANAVAIKNNIRLGLAGDKELIERAGRSLASLQSVPQLAAYPQNYAASLGALNLYLNTPVQIRLVCREPGAAGDSPVSIDRDMRAILFGRYLPGAEVQINYGSTDPKAKLPAVYICRDQVCEPPITQVSRLKERLSESTLYRQK